MGVRSLFAAEPSADSDTGREGEDGAECDEQVSDVPLTFEQRRSVQQLLPANWAGRSAPLTARRSSGRLEFVA
jgi:hypothetical protein